MPPSDLFDDADLQQIRERGIDPGEALRQIEHLRQPPPSRPPERPCKTGDGVRQISVDEHAGLLERWSEAATSGRLTKMVPASGAATRMFRRIRAYLEDGAPERAQLEDRAARGDAQAAELLELFAALPHTAVHRALAERLDQEAMEDPRQVAQGLLGKHGLGLGDRPKALIPFHAYPDGPRTAFEEHFVEAAGYLAAAGGTARLHFTTAEAACEDFAEAFGSFRERLEQRFGLRFELSTSTQQPDTDTLALDSDGEPFRREDGRLLFRPAGHGSLIGNLERLGGDIVLLKNIDNVAPERLQGPTILWKRLLVGCLLELEEQLAELEARLSQDPAFCNVAIEVLGSTLAIEPPAAVLAAGEAERRAWVWDRLARPLRVCGVVPRDEEPGGGPFWVPGEDGGLYGQILEAAQVDLEDSAQAAAWFGASHFNPVDLVCKLRDSNGRPFELARYVDPSAAFITEKTHGARTLRALERPGLWNGSMAGWNTVFVEVPTVTFNPVKQLIDLARPAHRA